MSSRADELLASGEAKRAAQLYRRALEIDETNERAYTGMSSALDSRQLHEQALEILTTAESILGWTPDIAVQRGIHLARLERWDACVATLERALKARPQSYEAAHYLATARLALEDWDGAIDATDVYLRHRPDALAARDSSVRNRRAFALLGAGRYARARRELDTVLATEPTNLSARMLLFTTLAKQGDCERALDLFAEIAQLSSTAPTLVYNAAVCRFRVGDARAALATLDEQREGWTPPKQAFLLRARIHAFLGDDARATESYRAAIAAGLHAHVELATWLAKLGEHTAVVELLWPLVSQASRDPELLELTASALMAASDFDRAVVASARLVDVRPDTGSWMLHAQVLMARKEWAVAEQSYARALATEPDHRPAAVGLRRALEHQATAAFRSGDRASAHALLVRAHEADASAHDVAYNLALLELDGGHAERAIELLEPRFEQLSSPRKGRLLLGRSYLQAGNTEAASRQFEAVIDDGETPPQLRARALSALAYTLAESSPQRALKLVARARKLGDSDAASRAALDRAEAEAQLALAQRAYLSEKFGALRSALGKVAVDDLRRDGKTRAKLLGLFARGHSKGLRSALRLLDEIPRDDLASVATQDLPAPALRHALALHLGRHFIKRPSDYGRYLRAHAVSLHKSTAGGSATVTLILTNWYDRMIRWSLHAPANKLARTLARDAPVAMRTPELRHNALIASAASARGHRSFSKAQVSSLEKLATAVPEALVNLAIDAEKRGDHASVLSYLARVPADRRTAAISEWIRWKELFHGAP